MINYMPEVLNKTVTCYTMQEQPFKCKTTSKASSSKEGRNYRVLFRLCLVPVHDHKLSVGLPLTLC